MGLTGGIILHQENIAEMRTGEGKTLAAALPSYLNALSGQRGLAYTIIDEVDSILIDETRMPLIISDVGRRPSKLDDACDLLARQMTRGRSRGRFPCWI